MQGACGAQMLELSRTLWGEEVGGRALWGAEVGGCPPGATQFPAARLRQGHFPLRQEEELVSPSPRSGDAFCWWPRQPSVPGALYTRLWH